MIMIDLCPRRPLCANYGARALAVLFRTAQGQSPPRPWCQDAPGAARGIASTRKSFIAHCMPAAPTTKTSNAMPTNRSAKARTPHQITNLSETRFSRDVSCVNPQVNESRGVDSVQRNVGAKSKVTSFGSFRDTARDTKNVIRSWSGSFRCSISFRSGNLHANPLYAYLQSPLVSS
jgi:hypothetical protein